MAAPRKTTLDVAPLFRQQVLERLREQIITGDLAPGALIAPTTLAEQLQTSVMPVREALRVLEQEGLIEVSARRYTCVASPGREFADEAYPLLATLEAFSIRRSSAPAQSMLVMAAAANERLSRSVETSARRRADVEFHRAITSAAGSITRATLSNLYGQVSLLEMRYHRLHSPRASVSEHEEILEQLQRGCLDEAAYAVEQHWLRGYAAILPMLDDQVTPPSREASNSALLESGDDADRATAKMTEQGSS